MDTKKRNEWYEKPSVQVAVAIVCALAILLACLNIWDVSQIIPQSIAVVCSAIAGAVLTAIITRFQLTKQSEEEEKLHSKEIEAENAKNKALQEQRDSYEDKLKNKDEALRKAESVQEQKTRLYQTKLDAYSDYIKEMWALMTDSEENLTSEKIKQFRAATFGKIIFYLNNDSIKGLTKAVEDITAEDIEKSRIQFSEISRLLKDDLDSETTKTQEDMSNEEDRRCMLDDLWCAFQTEEENTQPVIKIADRQYTGQFWHFNMWGYDQIRAIKNSKDTHRFELSLIEYGEVWRTNLVRQVKVGDIMFLFRPGGYGYIGAYKVLGYRIMNFTEDTEEIVINDQRESKKPIPQEDIDKFDIYKSKANNADLCSNVIVEQLAYYDKGVSFPGGVYRRTISRYDSGYGKTLLSRFYASINDKDYFGLLHESDGIPKTMPCNVDEFKNLVNDLKIQAAEKDEKGKWK